MDGRKQAALERLALLEPRELSVEAKTETCRATRDLRSCGRPVHHVLSTCGHACLCVECLQRSDSCPICRTPTANFGQDKLRLYEEFVDAGLTRKDAGLLPESADVGRLYSFFDVALDNNLVSLICHYVAEVCMDEGAVSSNALVSILLDGGVVKDWCKRTFHSIALELRGIYNLTPKQMISKADAIDWNGRKLEGVVLVLEALEAPLVDQPLSATLLELRQLLESMRKVLQHLEVMAWCARHQFLETIPSSYASISQWQTAVKERKSAAQDRAWSETAHNNGKLGVSQPATLFIEEALANLGLLEDDDVDEAGMVDLSELSWLCQGPTAQTPASLRFRRDLEPMQSRSPYPPESIRAAVDLLFLKGTCDLILAKKAIFLYFLFDRHWASSDETWRGVVDDYAGTFSIPRHLLLESLVFYLLDDSSDHALEEASQLLPEIANQNTHPKVVTVLLERHKAAAALAVLRASGRDGQAADLVSLADALTAVRVWLQCGLLTEGYSYQRAYVDGIKREGGDWLSSMEVLVSEVCRLCMSMSLLDKMLVLPWKKEEEKYVRKCLLDRAGQDPSTTAGNLLVVFYIQRCRYIEANAVHKRLIELEDLWGERCTDEAKFSRVRMASEQRSRIVEKCVELLPEVQQQQARNAVESDVESPQPEIMTVEEHRFPPLASPLFGHAGGNLIREPMPFEESNLPSTSAWANMNQPSFAQERLGLRSPARSSPILSNMHFPKTNGPTPARDFVSMGESPVQGRRLRYEAEQPKEPSLYPTIDFGDVQRGDGLDAAGPGSWATGVEKRMPVKMNGTDLSGNGSHLTLENGFRTDGLLGDDNDTMETDLERAGTWPSNGKRQPSDRSWLQKTGEKDASKDFTFTGIDAENGPSSVASVLPWESSKRNAEADENGGSRWRSDEGGDEPVSSLTPATRLKALSQSQGRSRSRFHSFRV
ncbi:hypothetical protein M758_2G213700 [Ceratodon purpureus]|nr:hypothetical protein M758_2G213700 [Ceratodon purpureus]